MAKAKFRRIEQKQTVTKREQYENALTLDRLENRQKKLSYVEIDLGGGEKANLYFTSVPAIEGVVLRDPALEPWDRFMKMISILADHVVDPHTGKPLRSREAWEKEDEEFLFAMIAGVTGLQLIREGEAEEEGENVIEVEVDIEELRNDPNPLDETVGSASPTTSTENSNPDKEMSSAG